ncbi:MAG TPA: DUF4296 domain-containing protein [Crocinitomicaceae bacterium]|nr:DUF4296 domain-containing protein [Crocinitomicaceae bacterium]
MRKSIFLLLTSFALFSCDQQGAQLPVPKDVIPVDTMIFIMSDMAVLENVVRRDFPQLAQQAEIVKNSGDSLLKNYNIDYNRYKQSLDYYTFSPDTMIYIYEKMSDNITVKLHEVEKER